MKKILLITLALCLPTWVLAETSNTPATGNIAIHIVQTYYEHPVRLNHPYIDYWHMTGPATEKAALSTLQQSFQHVQTCQQANNAQVLLLIDPYMFYNPQSHLFYTKLIVKAYNNPNNHLPILKITKEVQQVGELGQNPEFYINKAYKHAMQLVTDELQSNQAFMDSTNTVSNTNIESICPILDEQAISHQYY
jgi:hypothetical protein